MHIIYLVQPALSIWEPGKSSFSFRPAKETKNPSTDARYHIAVALTVSLPEDRKRKRACRHNNKYMTLNGGSLGSWIDEERSKVR